MRIAFLLGVGGDSPLLFGLRNGLLQLGHEVSLYTSHEPADLIVVANQTAHTTEYEYAEFPKDKTPIVFVDAAEYGWRYREPEQIPRFWNAFAEGSVSHPTKNAVQQERLKNFLSGRSFPYFLREFFKDWKFPAAYHPIDYPLYGLTPVPQRPVREEFMRRSVDVACMWGLSHPTREGLTRELEAYGGPKDVYALEDGIRPRLPHDEYCRRLSAAKCSVSFDGYGSSSFRMTEVLVRTALLLGPLQIKMRAQLHDHETCFTYKPGQLADHVARLAANPQLMFEVYERGYDHCLSYLTERATARYLIETVESHDWTKPTEI